MADLNRNIGENNLENATAFLHNDDVRKAPNNRVNGYDFLEIANVGAEKVKNELIKRKSIKR